MSDMITTNENEIIESADVNVAPVDHEYGG